MLPCCLVALHFDVGVYELGLVGFSINLLSNPVMSSWVVNNQCLLKQADYQLNIVFFFFLISKKKILLMKEKLEKYNEFTVVNEGKRSKKTEAAPKHCFQVGYCI